MKMELRVPKRRRLKFKHRGITQNKEYNKDNFALRHPILQKFLPFSYSKTVGNISPKHCCPSTKLHDAKRYKTVIRISSALKTIFFFPKYGKSSVLFCEGKGKGHPRADHEDPEGE